MTWSGPWAASALPVTTPLTSSKGGTVTLTNLPSTNQDLCKLSMVTLGVGLSGRPPRALTPLIRAQTRACRARKNE